MTHDVSNSSPGCFNCGAAAHWQDPLTGAARCRGCLISCGGGKPHVLIAADPVDANDQAADEDDDPLAVWDELEATMPPDQDAAVAEWMACAIEQGKQQAMEIDRIRGSRRQ